jgi:holin-like protein
MLGALTVLLLYQLLGEVLVHVLALPVPGPVVGMLALFLTLMVRGALSAPLRETANGILQHLSLLFVPAGTGVMVHFARVSGEWLPLVAALLASTALAIGAAALTMRLLMRYGAAQQGGEK